ncbi:preprotein translocase subunit YajC [Liquorilactobacillus sicerae]|uniref:preprotein translocase subunit YajC n=1 Tax=Liquorilactobacillus sicerae TaxID=1416943 RepID=UPI0024808EA4|nr:preprotein translocase subunit YajC [Liquorilactobacillus sicerae]
MNSSTISTIIMFAALIALMYFMMIRPQKKQQQKRQQMLGSLKKGDEVITLGRLHGTIDSLDTANHTVVLDCDGIYLTFEASAIMQVKNSATVKATDKSVNEQAKETKQQAIEDKKQEDSEN